VFKTFSKEFPSPAICDHNVKFVDIVVVLESLYCHCGICIEGAIDFDND